MLIPCIRSGKFIRYQPQPGQRHSSGGPLCPAKGCGRVASATADLTKSSSRRLGLGLVSIDLQCNECVNYKLQLHSYRQAQHTIWYRNWYFWPLYMKVCRRARDVGARNTRYPSNIHCLRPTNRPGVHECVHTQQLWYAWHACIPRSSSRPLVSMDVPKILTLIPLMPSELRRFNSYCAAKS